MSFVCLFAPYMLKKSHSSIYTLVSKYFVIYTLAIAKKRPLYVKQLTPLAPSYEVCQTNSLRGPLVALKIPFFNKHLLCKHPFIGNIFLVYYYYHDNQVNFINIFQTSCHLQVKNSNIKISKAQKVIIIIIIIIVISYMS